MDVRRRMTLACKKARMEQQRAIVDRESRRSEYPRRPHAYPLARLLA